MVCYPSRAHCSGGSRCIFSVCCGCPLAHSSVRMETNTRHLIRRYLNHRGLERSTIRQWVCPLDDVLPWRKSHAEFAALIWCERCNFDFARRGFRCESAAIRAVRTLWIGSDPLRTWAYGPNQHGALDSGRFRYLTIPLVRLRAGTRNRHVRNKKHRENPGDRSLHT